METQTVILVVLLVACVHIQTGKVCGRCEKRIYFKTGYMHAANILQQNCSLDIAPSRGLAIPLQ